MRRCWKPGSAPSPGGPVQPCDQKASRSPSGSAGCARRVPPPATGKAAALAARARPRARTSGRITADRRPRRTLGTQERAGAPRRRRASPRRLLRMALRIGSKRGVVRPTQSSARTLPSRRLHGNPRGRRAVSRALRLGAKVQREQGKRRVMSRSLYASHVRVRITCGSARIAPLRSPLHGRRARGPAS